MSVVGRMVVASANAHKIAEIRDLLGPRGWRVLSAPEGFSPLEDGATFAANAAIKARALAALLPTTGGAKPSYVLADDSGLVVPALGGAPGVHSARYAEPTPNFAGDQDGANRAKLMHAMAGLTEGARAAHFVCVLALVAPGGAMQHFYGRVDGHISLAPAGTTGFGYDALFVPEGIQKTFAQAGPAAKQQLSHRSRALVAMLQALSARGQRSEPCA